MRGRLSLPVSSAIGTARVTAASPSKSSKRNGRSIISKPRSAHANACFVP